MLPYIIKVAWSKKLGATVLNWEDFAILMRIEAPPKILWYAAYSKHFDLESFFFHKRHLQTIFTPNVFKRIFRNQSQ